MRTPFAISHKSHGLALADDETFPDFAKLGWEKSDKTVEEVAAARAKTVKPRAKRDQGQGK